MMTKIVFGKNANIIEDEETEDTEETEDGVHADTESSCKMSPGDFRTVVWALLSLSALFLILTGVSIWVHEVLGIIGCLSMSVLSGVLTAAGFCELKGT